MGKGAHGWEPPKALLAEKCRSLIIISENDHSHESCRQAVDGK
jgi:hypothetical protein